MPTIKKCVEFINSQKISSLSQKWKQTYQGKGLRSFSNPKGQTVTLMQEGNELMLYRLDMYSEDISAPIFDSKGEKQLQSPATPQDVLEFMAHCVKEDIRVVERADFYYFPGDENTPVTKLREKASQSSQWKIVESWTVENMGDFWQRYAPKSSRGTVSHEGQNLFYYGDDFYPMMVVKEGLAQVFYVQFNQHYAFLVYESHDHGLMLGVNQIT